MSSRFDPGAIGLRARWGANARLNATLSGAKRALIGSALVAACSGSFADDGNGDGAAHAPAEPKAQIDVVPESGADVSDGSPLDVPTETADSNHDKIEAEAEAEAAPDGISCPETSCSGTALVHSQVIGGECYAYSWEYCDYGCGPYGAVLACLPSDPPGPCVLNVAPDGGSCAYLVKSFCFETFEAACQCAGCSAPSCTASATKKGGRLKWKSVSKDGSADVSSTGDADAALDDAEAAVPAADAADGPSDAAPVTMIVTCK